MSNDVPPRVPTPNTPRRTPEIEVVTALPPGFTEEQEERGELPWRYEIYLKTHTIIFYFLSEKINLVWNTLSNYLKEVFNVILTVLKCRISLFSTSVD